MAVRVFRELITSVIPESD